MLFFFNLSEYFLSWLSEVGDWLLSSPFGSLGDEIAEFVPEWGNLTIAHIILGAGLVFILSAKLLRFLVGLD